MAVKGYQNIVTDGIVLSVDAYNIKSYVNGNTDTYNLVSNNVSGGTLLNGVGYDENTWTFDGVSDYIDFGAATPILNLSNWTFGVWVRADVGTTGNWYIGGSGDSTGGTGTKDERVNFGILWRYENNFVDVRSSTGTAFKIARYSINPTLGEWHYFVNTYDGSNLRLWIDGVNVATLNESFTPYTSSNKFVIGDDAVNSRPLNGNVSNFHIYNRALTTEEVNQNYESQKWRFL
jgi:hypothetical protein